jgi:hypothetical protein
LKFFFSVETKVGGTLTLLDMQTCLTYHVLNHFLDGGDCGDEYHYSPLAMDWLTSARLIYVIFSRGSLQQTLELGLELNTPLTLSTDRKSRSKQ